MKKVIEIQDLVFRYPSSNEDAFTLHVKSWELGSNEKAVLHGPSGCGKSTLLNLISGALAHQEGTLNVLGVSRRGSSEAQRRAHRISNIGFVFQDFPLIPYLSAVENVLLPYRINPILQLEEKSKLRAKELLNQLGLHGKEKRYPMALSQGERQRVAIARAMITNPKLLLADEPTAGLDPERSASVMTLLEKMVHENDCSLLVVTHDPMIRQRFDLQLSLGGV